MRKLKSRQAKLLKLITQNASDPLTIRELGDKANIRSPGVVAHHLNALLKKGHIKKRNKIRQ